jgi:hypothetical protein
MKVKYYDGVTWPSLTVLLRPVHGACHTIKIFDFSKIFQLLKKIDQILKLQTHYSDSQRGQNFVTEGRIDAYNCSHSLYSTVFSKGNSCIHIIL